MRCNVFYYFLHYRFACHVVHCCILHAMYCIVACVAHHVFHCSALHYIVALYSCTPAFHTMVCCIGCQVLHCCAACCSTAGRVFHCSALALHCSAALHVRYCFVEWTLCTSWIALQSIMYHIVVVLYCMPCTALQCIALHAS